MKINFLPFLDTFVSKIRENVSRNGRNDKKCLKMGENVFSHFWTLLKSVQKWEKRNFSCLQALFVVFPVSRQFFSYFQTQKCLEMGNMQNGDQHGAGTTFQMFRLGCWKMCTKLQKNKPCFCHCRVGGIHSIIGIFYISLKCHNNNRL